MADAGTTRLSSFDRMLLDEAVAQAEKSFAEGGIPIGAAIGAPALGVVASGHNLRVQQGDATAHGETACLRAAGRRRDWHTLTMATTLSPCVMCAGALLLHRVPRVIIGEHENFMGEEALLRERGVELIVAHDATCLALMRRFIAEQPELWNEDIGVPGDDSGGDGEVVA